MSLLKQGGFGHVACPFRKTGSSHRARDDVFKLLLRKLEKDQPGPGSQAGYYETLPNSPITMCATLPAPQGSTGTETNCPLEAKDHLDLILDAIMTNPVNLQYDSTNGAFDFAPNPEAGASATSICRLRLTAKATFSAAVQSPPGN